MSGLDRFTVWITGFLPGSWQFSAFSFMRDVGTLILATPLLFIVALILWAVFKAVLFRSNT